MLDLKFQSLFLSEYILAVDYIHWKHIAQIYGYGHSRCPSQ